MSTPILKTLIADPESTPDLSAHTPDLEGEALEVWQHFVINTPYWWGGSDILTVERFCFLVSADRHVREMLALAENSDDTSSYIKWWGVMKSLAIELKSIEYSLGLTPQGRAALKLDTPADQGAREAPEESEDPLDPDEL